MTDPKTTAPPTVRGVRSSVQPPVDFSAQYMLRTILDELRMLAAARPQGCVCPPTAETTCKGIACPRRCHNYSQVSGT